jgi:hypothetical protein
MIKAILAAAVLLSVGASASVGLAQTPVDFNGTTASSGDLVCWNAPVGGSPVYVKDCGAGGVGNGIYPES